MLTIGIDARSKTPLYEQIYKYIRDEIQSGNMQCGMKLPSSRKLAQHLDVSRNTVDLAYGQLLSEGYIESKPKKGYYVCVVDEILEFSNEILEIEEKSECKKQYPYDFSIAGVDMEHFPYNTWRKLMREMLMDDNSQLFQIGDSNGDLELREAIRAYLHQSRGVNCKANQIILGSGTEYLLILLSQIFGEEKTIAMENPTYLQVKKVFDQLKFPVEAIMVDEHGIQIEQLKNSKAQVAYVTPSHQYPTGIVMPIKRRNALLNWAMEQEGRYIIEDDYDSEFRYQGRPIPSLQGNDRGGKVIYLGTFSKAIAPAIRVSYMVLPMPLLKEYQERLSFYSCTVSRIDQAVLTAFLKEGHFERHLNRMRAVYRGKYQCLMQQLKTFGDQVEISGYGEGLHILIEFKEIADHKAFRKELDCHGVRLIPVSDYYIEKRPEKEKYILGFARLRTEQIKEGILLIQEIYDKIRQQERKKSNVRKR